MLPDAPPALPAANAMKFAAVLRLFVREIPVRRVLGKKVDMSEQVVFHFLMELNAPVRAQSDA